MSRFMTESQFATFRADVQRAARLEVREMQRRMGGAINTLTTENRELREQVEHLINCVEALDSALAALQRRVAGTTTPVTPAKPRDGDELINPQTGETFWWYRGEFRRRSELETYRDALRACGL